MEWKLVEKIRESGVKLKFPPTLTSEFLILLDETERLLAVVTPAPSTAMHLELQSVMAALARKQMLSHANDDVRTAVLACVCQVIRITILDNPYSDKTMKLVFQGFVECFHRIDDLKSRSYRKRVSILESLAEVRSCIIMLDLEMHGLILEMFQCFLQRIRCVDKLKPLLQVLVGGRTKKYSASIVSLCQETSYAMAHGNIGASKNESERAVSDKKDRVIPPVYNKKQNQKQKQKQKQKQNPKSKNPSSVRQKSSRFRGVRKRKSGNWAAEIRDSTCGVRYWLGTFPSEEEAHQAYQAASYMINKEKAQIAQGKKAQQYQTAAPPYQAATSQCQLCQTSGKQCQSYEKTAQRTQEIMQQCQFCREDDLIPEISEDEKEG